MTLSKKKLKDNLAKLYTTKTAEASFVQWNSSLTDYFKDAQSNAFRPSDFGVDLANGFRKSANSKSFIEDFDKNITEWISAVSWTDGKDTKKSAGPEALGFQSFSKTNEKANDFNKYQDDLASLLHNWFSKITV